MSTNKILLENFFKLQKRQSRGAQDFPHNKALKNHRITTLLLKYLRSKSTWKHWYKGDFMGMILQSSVISSEEKDSKIPKVN